MAYGVFWLDSPASDRPHATAAGMAEGTSRPILDALGNFFQSIFDWIKSPDGQAFLSALAKILLSLLAGA